MDGLMNSMSELSLVFYVSASMMVHAQASSCIDYLSHHQYLKMHKTEELVIPKIELNADEENVRVSMELPGMTIEDLKLKITDQQLDVKGIQKIVRKKSLRKSFQRTLTFPSQVLSEKADAQFSNGVLTVTVPIASESRKKCIASIIQVH